MNKIYIFGDSFSDITPDPRPESWVYKISEKFDVINKSRGGASNAYIFLKFLETYEQITPQDTVIFCWSEYTRFYFSDPSAVSNDPKFFKKLFKRSHNKQLMKFHDISYLKEIKQIINERNLKVLFLWSFPSEYLRSFYWCDPNYDINDVNQFFYHTEFKNEVRPALIYYSIKEVPKSIRKENSKLINYFTTDTRPNHIENTQIHLTITKIVTDFANNLISGKINIEDYLKNEK